MIDNMLFPFYITFITITTSQFYVKCGELEEIKIIQNYVEKQNTPSMITFYTCWTKDEILQLTQELNKAHIYINVHINFSKIVEFKPLQHSLIISDSSCPDFEILIQTAEERKLFKSPVRWLIFKNSDYLMSPSMKLLIDSNFAIVSKNSNGEFELKLVYKYKYNDKTFVYNNLGRFVNDSFVNYNPFLTAVNRTNLMGSTLTASYVLTNPAYPLDVEHYRNSHIDGVSKLSFVMVDNMMDVLNCTKHYIQHKSWGYKKPNETYYDGGMFGDVQNGTAEIAGTVAFYTLSRQEIVDYVSVTTPSDMKFILRAPPLSYVNNLFALPFEPRVWYGLYMITGFTVLILYGVVICESKCQESLKNENNIANVKPTFFDVVMVQIGAITQQGSDAEPKSYSGRIAVFIVFLVLMFLYTAYSASVVVLLQSTSDSIRTIQDLLYSNIELGVEDIVYSKYYFESQKEPIRKAIYETKIAPKGQKANYLKVDDGIKKMREEFFGFHVETTSGYKVVKDTFQEHEKCGLIEVDYLNTLWPSISVRKHSAYKEIIKVAFRKIYESGIRHRHTNRIYHKKPQCTSKGGTFTSVGIIDSYFAFVIFAIGNLISLWLLLIEVLFAKYYQSCFEWIFNSKSSNSINQENEDNA